MPSNLFSLHPLSRLVYFGHPPQGVLEGSLYTRRFLYSSNAHRADQKGVNGNMANGSDSIVVSRQSPDCREEDGLQWLRYTSNRMQGEVCSLSLIDTDSFYDSSFIVSYTI